VTRNHVSDQTFRMKTTTKCIVLVAGMAACNGPRVVDLGGRDQAPIVGGDAAVASDAAPAVGDNVVASDAAPAVGATCTYTGPYSDGSGYLADPPSSCTDASGALESFTSASGVAAALVGTWISCASGGSTNVFVRTLDSGAAGVEFRSDGTFTLLTTLTASTSDVSLVPATGASDSGTFVVLDASASLGPGTYQVRLSAMNGGVYTTQVVVFGATPGLRFFSPGADDYAPALTKKFEANVCGGPFGPVDSPASSGDAVARMQGKWARCPVTTSHMLGPLTTHGQGLEFPGDGTWYTLFEDSSGNLVRTTDPSEHGTFVVAGSAPFSLLFSTANGSGQTLDVVLGACGTFTYVEQDFSSYQYTHFN
jgi:hypothetical protein